MDNERRRFIKGGIATVLLGAGSVLLFEGVKDISTLREKEDDQNKKAESQAASKGRDLDLNTYRSELAQIRAKEGDLAGQAEKGFIKIIYGIPAEMIGWHSVLQLTEIPNIQSSLPANSTE